ncbi:multiple C2 and transmembrane domain-containing protein 1-like isoform X3 [Branchiostoma floridae x Branchiostoma belcheri]
MSRHAGRSDADTDSELGERCSVSSSSPEREPGAGRKSRKQRLLGYFKKKAKPRWPFLAEKTSQKSQGTSTKLKRDPRLTCSQPDIAHQGYDSPLRRPSLAPAAANGRVRGPTRPDSGQNGQDCAFAEVLPKEDATTSREQQDGATGYSPSHEGSTSGYNHRQQHTVGDRDSRGQADDLATLSYLETEIGPPEKETDGIPRPTARSVRHQYDFFTLDVTLKEGRRLAIRDKCGTSDPYVKFKYDGKQVYKSRIVYKNLNPRWDESFSLPVDDVTRPLVVKVFDYDRGLQDDPMGHAYIDLAALIIHRKEEFKVELEDPHVAEDLGYLLLDLTLVPKTSDEKEEYLAKRNRLVETQRSMKAQIWSSVVSLVLIEGKGLLPMDDNGLSDPYCKFRLGNEKYKSKVAAKTLDPRWLEQFDLHMYDDQTSVLEISVWDKDVGSKDDFMGRCQVDLSELKREETHHIEKELEDGAGSVSFLLTITGHASHAHSPPCWADGAFTHLGSAGNETITDLANYMPDPRERLEVQRRYSLLRSLRNLNDVGLLQVKVIKATGLLAADFGGKSDPFCVLELTNARLQTQTIYKTLNPEWGKVFTFQVKDIHSILEVSVYDEDRNKSAEFLGKVAIPLLRIKNGERKAFYLKDKKLRRRTKGSIVLEMEVIYNSIKASWRTFNPKEVKYLQMEQKFKRQILVRNLQRVSRLVMAVVNTGRFVKSCFEWESKTRSITAFIMYVLMVWNFELYMLPLVLLSIFFKYYIVRSVMEGRTDQQEEAEEEEQDEDEDDEERGKEKSKSFKEKLQAIQDVCQTVQNGLDDVASLGESVKNAFNWTVPFLSWLAVITLAIATVVLYFIPLRYLVLVWGINKFTKKLRNPNAIPNNELVDFLSRVPSDEELIEYKELKSEDTQQLSPKKKKTS